jgi:hypothetical protein
MSQQTENLGNPDTTPFVRFLSGTALYPLPTLYEAATDFLASYSGGDPSPVFKELVREGLVAGQYGVVLDATWFAILRTFVMYNAGNFEGITDWQTHCLDALRLMLERPHVKAWKRLKSFLLERIDNVSGWATSWQKMTAEREKIVRADDGNFYLHDEEGVLVRVIGAKPIDETRIDFITDHVIWKYGFVREFLELFSLFAITDDFATNREAYPPAMKAVLPEVEFQRVNHSWHFMYFDRSRTVKWRPYSNMCDPDWLASDLLGHIVDTLQIDRFRKRVAGQKPDELWSKDPRRFQHDYVIDSGLRLGSEEEIYLEFEGTAFRWINGTAERNAVAGMPVERLGDDIADVARLNRLLSALAWHHKVPVAKLWGAGGPRRAFPVVYGPRMSGAIQVDARYVQQDLARQLTAEQWFALGLFREGLNSRSKFYSYLCFYKVIEFALKKSEHRRDWINNTAPALSREKERISEILRVNRDLEKYLREALRNAIEHVWRKPTLDPDNPADEKKIATDIHVIEDLARLAIETVLGVT